MRKAHQLLSKTVFLGTLTEFMRVELEKESPNGNYITGFFECLSHALDDNAQNTCTFVKMDGIKLLIKCWDVFHNDLLIRQRVSSILTGLAQMFE